MILASPDLPGLDAWIEGTPPDDAPPRDPYGPQFDAELQRWRRHVAPQIEQALQRMEQRQ